MFEVIVEYTDKTKVVVADAILSLRDAFVVQDNILKEANSDIEFVHVERMNGYDT